MKLLIGGSPCTYWSIAQTKNRETEASGLGWELFKNYVIAREKYQPDYFLYENNKSMSAAIRAKITEELGVEPVLINSALVSAQSRQRLYWVGKRNADGTYSRVEIEQPEDRGIFLRDILESGVCWTEKAYTLRAGQGVGASSAIKTIRDPGKFTANGAAEPINATEDGKAYAIKASYSKSAAANFMNGAGHFPQTGAVEPVNVTADGKAQCLRATYYKDGIRNMVGNTVDRKTCAAEPVSFCLNKAESGKARTVDAHMAKLENNLVPRMCDPNPAKQQYDCIVEPIRIGTIESAAKNADFDSQQYRVYSPDGKSVTLCGAGGVSELRPASMRSPSMKVPEATKKGYCEIRPGECVDLTQETSKTRRGRAMVNKSNCLTTSCEFYEYCGTLDKPIYQVRDGFITIKGKQYPIKLRDGCYIIRKLTVTECKRLQTVPDNYEFPTSDTQAYKMLGNGWTVDVISHIMSHFDGLTKEPVEVLSMYDGMSCGHIALDKLGANVTRYYSTEIDKYAIQTTQHNFPDVIQLGDAFEVRKPEWSIKPESKKRGDEPWKETENSAAAPADGTNTKASPMAGSVSTETANIAPTTRTTTTPALTGRAGGDERRHSTPDHKESWYQAKIIRWLKDQYPGAFVWKAAAGPYSRQGIPDICAVIDGHFFGFEVKRPEVGRLSKIQEQTIHEINAAGGTALVVSFPADAKEAIDRWESETRK